MSGAVPWGRATPRWSVVTPAMATPAPMAGLPGNSAMVSVEPPLSASGPSKGFVLIRSVGASAREGASENRLWPCEWNAPEFVRLPPSLLSKMLVVTVSAPVPMLSMPPPAAAELPLMVELVTDRLALLSMPPPAAAELPLMVELVTVRVPVLSMPPPSPPTELRLVVELVTVRVPVLSMPPPSPPTELRLVVELPLMVQSVTDRVPALLMPPPSEELPPLMVRPETCASAPAGTLKIRKSGVPVALPRATVSADAPGLRCRCRTTGPGGRSSA